MVFVTRVGGGNRGPLLLEWHPHFMYEALGRGISLWFSWLTSPAIVLSPYEQAVVAVNRVSILFLPHKIPDQWELSWRRKTQISQLLLSGIEPSIGNLYLRMGMRTPCGLLLLGWYCSPGLGAREEAALCSWLLLPIVERSLYQAGGQRKEKVEAQTAQSLTLLIKIMNVSPFAICPLDNF